MKNRPEESYDSMINRMMNILEEDDSGLPTGGGEIGALYEDIREGRCVTHEELMKRHGLE